MLTASVSQLKNGLSSYLRRVKAGHTVLVMDRKTPVARIVPLSDNTGMSPGSSLEDQPRIERLLADGLATRERNMGAREALEQLGGSWPAGRGLLDALIDDRDADFRQGHR